MEIKEIKKTSQKYFCEVCDFKCSSKCDWNKHLLRAKHKKHENGNNLEIEKTFFCKCGKNTQITLAFGNIIRFAI
jgi:hypothetical protein